ncbi:WD repeat-containing protein 25-like [Saccostrea echinata]|uniref:WD repeat-containing protein 25-like n=1 Tax=Saccostrea echinata TaxID=191078 RepID=UPI002A80AB61|nr:WD repeat-containing protein 25-like [Saccostrea echinata]
MDLLKSYSDESETEDEGEEKHGEENSENKSNCNKTKSDSAEQSNVVDFFGLNDNSDEESQEPPLKKTRKYQLGSQKGTDSYVEVPDSNFWKNFTPQENPDDHNSFLEKRNVEKSVHAENHQIRTQRGQVYHQTQVHPRSSCQTNRGKVSGYRTKGHDHCTAPSDLTSQTFIRTHQSQQSFSSSIESQTQRQLFYVHSKIAPHLMKSNMNNRYPHQVEKELEDHTQTVNRVMWNNPPYSHLFLSASMDGTVRIWNIWTQLSPCVKLLNIHKKAVKDAVWSLDGRHILSCSYDKTAKWIDLEKGSVLSTFNNTSFVTSCKVHPNDPNLSITGCQNGIHCWDTRSSQSPCRTYTYKDSFGQVQDLLFNRDGNTFFSAGSEITQDSADRNIMAWDFRSSSVLSNQIYQERYSCTRLKLHPTSGHFLAQSHGNYIAMFSVNRPYKMNKAKRFEGHKLSGYSLGFDISPDGSLVLSGDGNGQLFCYNYQSGKIIQKTPTSMDILMDVSFNPVLPSTVVVCGWNGKIQVLN